MWHDQCNWAQYNTSLSNDNVLKVLTKSVYCFSLISVARKVRSAPPVNKSSTFQSFGRVTGDRFHRQQTHAGDRSPDVSDTISQCIPEYAEISSHRGSHFTECAEEPNDKSPTSKSGRTKQRIRTARSAQETRTRIRTARSARILELQIEIDKLFLAEFTKRARCDVTTTPTDDV